MISSILVLVTLLFLTLLFAPLFFANESIHDVDTTGVQSLEELIEDLEKDGITFAIARLRNAVRGVLDAADLIERIGE